MADAPVSSSKFAGTPAFITRPFVIDFEKKEAVIQPIKSKFWKAMDTVLLFFFGFELWVPIAIIRIFIPFSLFTVCIIWACFWLSFVIWYKRHNEPLARKMLMIFEESENWMFKKRTNIIKLQKHSKVEIILENYITFKLHFSKKKQVQKIIYDHKLLRKRNKLIILFKKPVTGKMIFHHRSQNFKGIRRYLSYSPH